MLRRISAARSVFRHVNTSSQRALFDGAFDLHFPLWRSTSYRHVSTTRKRRSASHQTTSSSTTLSDYDFSFDTQYLSRSRHSTQSQPSTPSPIIPPATPANNTTVKAKPAPSRSRKISHNNLLTYLAHVQRTNVSQTSSTYLGTRYEYLVLQHLESTLNFQLTRVGGRGDKGIDLIGTWTLPDPSADARQDEQDIDTATTIRVIIQTKRSASLSTSAPPLPSYLRALEGTLNSTSRPASTLGILISTRPATEGLRRAMTDSKRALMYMCIEEQEEEAPENIKEQYDSTQSSLTKQTLLSQDSEMVDTNHRAGIVDVSFDKVSMTVDDTHEDILKKVSISGEGHNLAEVVEVENKSAENPLIPTTRIVQILWNQPATMLALEGFSVGTSYSAEGMVDQTQLLWQGRPIRFKSKAT